MNRHTTETLRAFLKGETRQVWARVRETGEPVYLEVGDADRARKAAKTIWGCIIPTCDAGITTRGGINRDHFYHPGGPSHGGGGVETMNHLAGKAMLAAWAQRVAPDTIVSEETTLKDGAVGFNRRPDVLVIWDKPDKLLLALEVEYKQFPYEAWQAKQDDYTTRGIACSWLLGHTQFKATRVRAGQWNTTVKVPRQGDIIAAAGLHVLIVNPFTEQIGTLAGDKAITTKVPPKSEHAWLALDDLTECELSPQGLITPTMRRIDKAIEERKELQAKRLCQLGEANAEKRRLAEEKRQRALEEQERLGENARRKLELRECWDRRRTVWEDSTLRSTMIERWGELPKVIDDFGNKPGGIHAHPPHWHAVLYEQLIHEVDLGSEFTDSDCWVRLNKANISTSHRQDQRVESLHLFLASLALAGLIERAGNGWSVQGQIMTLAQQQKQKLTHFEEGEKTTYGEVKQASIENGTLLQAVTPTKEMPSEAEAQVRQPMDLSGVGGETREESGEGRILIPKRTPSQTSNHTAPKSNKGRFKKILGWFTRR